jgi:hypothetical protein
MPGTGGLLSEWAETVPDLMWPEQIRTYGRMRHDPRLKAILTAYSLPILRTTWAVDPEGIARSEAVDLVASDMGLPILGEATRPAAAAAPGFRWYDHLRLALLSHVYGFAAFERWYDTSGPRTRLAGVQERLPHSIAYIDIDDRTGLIKAVAQNTQPEEIPAARLLWYVNQREGANWAGLSLLRESYTPWVLKHEVMRVHATSIRRFGMGVPNVEAPAGATPAQVEQARQLAAGMRVGDQSGAGLPAGFRMNLTGLTGSVPDALGFLSWCNQEMSGSALAQIIELGTTSYGPRALGETFLDLFLLALQAAADAIGDNVTYGEPGMPGLAKDLVEINWGEGEPVPRIVATDVGDRHEITAFAISEMVKSGALQPDASLDAFIREAWGLPQRTSTWTPPSAPAPAPERGAPAAPPAAAPGAAPPAVPGAAAASVLPARPARAARRARLWPFRAAPPAGLRRNVTRVEAAAGYDPVSVQAEWQAALDALLAAWAPVRAAQVTALEDQVTAVVAGGKIDRLAGLTADPAAGEDVIREAMGALAETAAQRMIREAYRQAVDIPAAGVKVNDARLARVAAGRASLASSGLAQQAGTKAMQVTASAADDAKRAGEQVGIWLAGLSQAQLRDQLGAALSTAQNAGRTAVLRAAPASAGTAVYVASEILDVNTCPPCQAIDEHQFGSLAEAEAAYVNGGYYECEGFLRCRGTVAAVWGGVTPALCRTTSGPAASARRPSPTR